MIVHGHHRIRRLRCCRCNSHGEGGADCKHGWKGRGLLLEGALLLERMGTAKDEMWSFALSVHRTRQNSLQEATRLSLTSPAHWLLPFWRDRTRTLGFITVTFAARRRRRRCCFAQRTRQHHPALLLHFVHVRKKKSTISNLLKSCSYRLRSISLLQQLDLPIFCPDPDPSGLSDFVAPTFLA